MSLAGIFVGLLIAAAVVYIVWRGIKAAKGEAGGCSCCEAIKEGSKTGSCCGGAAKEDSKQGNTCNEKSCSCSDHKH